MKGSIETRVKALVSRHFNLPPSKVGLDAAFVEVSEGLTLVIRSE